MKAYWDSGAIILALGDPALRRRLEGGDQHTRLHSLAEVFSTLTSGKLGRRYTGPDATAIVGQVAAEVSFVDLDSQDMLAAMHRAESLGVRGGRIHDLMHAVAADKIKAEVLLTTDRNDLTGLTAIQLERL